MIVVSQLDKPQDTLHFLGQHLAENGLVEVKFSSDGCWIEYCLCKREDILQEVGFGLFLAYLCSHWHRTSHDDQWTFIPISADSTAFVHAPRGSWYAYVWGDDHVQDRLLPRPKTKSQDAQNGYLLRRLLQYNLAVTDPQLSPHVPQKHCSEALDAYRRRLESWLRGQGDKNPAYFSALGGRAHVLHAPCAFFEPLFTELGSDEKGTERIFNAFLALWIAAKASVHRTTANARVKAALGAEIEVDVLAELGEAAVRIETSRDREPQKALRTKLKDHRFLQLTYPTCRLVFFFLGGQSADAAGGLDEHVTIHTAHVPAEGREADVSAPGLQSEFARLLDVAVKACGPQE